MIKLKYIYCFIILLTLIISCKKDDVKDLPQENSPVFKINGNINGEVFEIEAGENNAYMYSFTEMYNGVEKFSGKLSNDDLSIELGVYNGKQDFIAANFLSNLNLSVLGATLPNGYLIKLDKNDLLNASEIQSIQWYANNVFIGQNVALINEPGNYSICANITFLDGTQTTICNQILAGFHQGANFKINHILKQDGSLLAWINPQIGTIESIEWKVDGETVSIENNASIEIEDDGQIVTANVKFTNGVIKTKSVYIDGDEETKFFDDLTQFEMNPSNNIEWDYKMVLKIRKGTNEYRSDFIGNPLFTVMLNDVSYYGLNTNGNKVYKMNAIVNTNVKNVATGTVLPVNFTTDFGIEIKD
ncbi:MAG: hypothetical protein HYR91_12480 [Flavobacteriia bacterium]|nr:hypothetical protein [Flavobacteriia bacterium]